MTDAEMKTLAERARNTWEYSKTVGWVGNPKFKQWFENRARQLYRLNDSEIAQLWETALRIYS
jgi:predicted transposase YbfD/YdcC